MLLKYWLLCWCDFRRREVKLAFSSTEHFCLWLNEGRVIHPTKIYSGIVLLFRVSSPSLVETQLLTHSASSEKHSLCDLRVQSRAVWEPRTSRMKSRLVTCVICDVAFRRRYYQWVPSGCCLFLLFLQRGVELTCFWATERGCIQ